MSNPSENEQELVEQIAESVASTGFLTKKQARAYLLRHENSPYQVNRETAAEITGVKPTTVDDRFSEAKDRIEGAIQGLDFLDSVMSEDSNTADAFNGHPMAPFTPDAVWDVVDEVDQFNIFNKMVNPRSTPYDSLIRKNKKGNNPMDVLDELAELADVMPVEQRIRIINPITGNEILGYDTSDLNDDDLRDFIQQNETVATFSLSDSLDELVDTLEEVEDEYEDVVFLPDPFHDEEENNAENHDDGVNIEIEGEEEEEE